MKASSFAKILLSFATTILVSRDSLFFATAENVSPRFVVTTDQEHHTVLQDTPTTRMLTKNVPTPNVAANCRGIKQKKRCKRAPECRWKKRNQTCVEGPKAIVPESPSSQPTALPSRSVSSQSSSQTVSQRSVSSHPSSQKTAPCAAINTQKDGFTNGGTRLSNDPCSEDTSNWDDTTKVTDQDLLGRIDKWLANNNYNQYGDQMDTIYRGGSPLIDEATGIFTDRLTYLLHKFPALETYYGVVNATDLSIDVTVPSSNPTETDTSGVETLPKCPCFDRGDLMWAFNRMAYLNVDVANDLSCNVDGISNTLRILYTNIDTADMINGISYTDLSVIYDELGIAPTTNMCSDGKTFMSLDAEQAKACHELLYEACQSIRSRTCPCFDLVTLEGFVQDAINEDIGIDLVHSCKDDTYSIFIEQQVQCFNAPCPPISVVQYGMENNPQMCLNRDSADSPQNVTSQQDTHCRKLLHHSCQVIDYEIIQTSESPTTSA